MKNLVFLVTLFLSTVAFAQNTEEELQARFAELFGGKIVELGDCKITASENGWTFEVSDGKNHALWSLGIAEMTEVAFHKNKISLSDEEIDVDVTYDDTGSVPPGYRRYTGNFKFVDGQLTELKVKNESLSFLLLVLGFTTDSEVSCKIE